MSYTDDGDDLSESNPTAGYSEEILKTGKQRVLPKGTPRKKAAEPAPSRRAAPPQSAGTAQSLPPNSQPKKQSAKQEKAPTQKATPASAPQEKAVARKTVPPQEPTPARIDKSPSEEPPQPVVKKPVKLRPPAHVQPHPLEQVPPPKKKVPASQSVAKSEPRSLPEPVSAENTESLDDDELFHFDAASTPDLSENEFLSFEEDLPAKKSSSLPSPGVPSSQAKSAQESKPVPVQKPKETPSRNEPPPRETQPPWAPPKTAVKEQPAQKRTEQPVAKQHTPEKKPINRSQEPPVTTTEPSQQPQRPAAEEPSFQSGSSTPSSPAVTGEILLKTEGLVKIYDGRTVVNGVDISVRKGEIVGLLGPNGAGKTTSFYMIVGLVPPNGGSVDFGGDDVTKIPMYQRARLGMGYLPQEESIFRKLTVEENIMAVMETLPIPRNQKVDRCNELLERFSITHIRKNVALTCSGGEKRRLTIARSLVTEPSLLMLDEPFSGVDPIAVNEIQSIVEDLRKSGLAILITDHNARQTLELVDRAYLIYEGRVLREGSGEFLINDPVSRELYLGDRFSM